MKRSGTARQQFRFFQMLVGRAVGALHAVEHGCHIAHGACSKDQAVESSTWRELRAVRIVLEFLIPNLKNELAIQTAFSPFSYIGVRDHFFFPSQQLY